MKRKIIQIVTIALALFFINGCNGVGGLGSNWSDAQKEEFLQILNEDSYSSVCNLQDEIAQYKKSKDDKILSDLLVKYAQNLANGCIDQDYFQQVLSQKRANNIKTYYKFYNEYVSSSEIENKLKKGSTIKEILAPYVPEFDQFEKLIQAYNATSDPTLKYKIKINIERVKLLNPDGWNTFVLINVPEYKFRFFRDKQKLLEFKVVVGRPTWQTPIFSAKLKYITVNPTWNVPDNIARKEEIPRIIKDPSYLRRHNMVVKRDYAPDSPTIDPRKINWKEYLKPEWEHKELPYKIIQLSSSRNALGRVKFMFPNQFSVYMHDTNMKKLFAYEQRAFSHGCIRLEKPLTFLGYLASSYTKQKFDEVGSILKTKETKYIGLNEYIPVHIVYLTAFVKDDGMVHFFNDIYGFDKITRLNVPTKMVQRK